MTGTTSVPARNGIFISYRRDDARGASGRLYDWLRIGFGRDQVFRDVASIGVGRWRDKIDQALQRSAVCVAVVGTRWANADNLLRLHDAADMVRHELLTALADPAVTIVPTLVENAPLPATADLPPQLRALFDDWNVRPVSESGWEDDTRRLINEVATATGLAKVADLDELMTAQRQLAALEQQKQMQAGQIEALNRTVEDLRTRLAEAAPAQRAGLAEAFAALARGESAQAEDAFEREYQTLCRAAVEARFTAAEAARNVANLALLRDVAKAVVFYRKALDAEAESAETARLLAHALITQGDLPAARIAMTESLRLAKAHADTWAEMEAQDGLGDIHLATGDLGSARAAYAAVQQLAQRNLSLDPAIVQWQRALSVSYWKIGHLLADQCGIPVAIQAWQEALTIELTDTAGQCGVSVSHGGIGDEFLAQGDGLSKDLALLEWLVARDPADTMSQYRLASLHVSIGTMSAFLEVGPSGMMSFRKSLSILEALTALDPANMKWKWDLSVSHDKIGDLLAAQGDGLAALQAFRKGLAISEALVAHDPANLKWKWDLSVSHDKIGDLLAAQGDGLAALQAFRKGLAIKEALAAHDPANAKWRRGLSVSHQKIGDVLVAQGDGLAALQAFRESLAISEVLAAREPANAEWQGNLLVSHLKVGEGLHAQGDELAAMQAFRESLAIAEALAGREPDSVGAQAYLAAAHAKLGTCSNASTTERGQHLRSGLRILEALVADQRTTVYEDNLDWFRKRLAEIG